MKPLRNPPYLHHNLRGKPLSWDTCLLSQPPSFFQIIEMAGLTCYIILTWQLFKIAWHLMCSQFSENIFISGKLLKFRWSFNKKLEQFNLFILLKNWVYYFGLVKYVQDRQISSQFLWSIFMWSLGFIC